MSKSTQELNTHGITITFGKHKGTLLTRVPVGYLRWMMNEQGMQGNWRLLAKSEYERRGGEIPTIELSGHAIDNASLRCRKIWHETRTEDEGLYTWLMRMTHEAIQHNVLHGDKLCYRGMRFVVVQGEEYPVLRTIMPGKPSDEREVTNTLE